MGVSLSNFFIIAYKSMLIKPLGLKELLSEREYKKKKKRISKRQKNIKTDIKKTDAGEIH